MAGSAAMERPTIFALASGSARAGVAVVRVSGPAAAAGLARLTGKANLAPRQMRYLPIRDPESGVLLDRGMAVFFPGPASFTGEDVVEYHLHGGKSVVDGVLAALAKIPESRLAEPGEFTRRAFENGKMDLTEAEAVADLIAAETEAQRLLALDQLGGGLAALYRGWTERLSALLAHQEAEIEFPEDDLPQGIAAGILPQIESLLREITAHLNDRRRGEMLRSGVMIAIVGAPNAGKSSLLNALAARDAAIVSEEAGTTRDVIEVHLDLGGYPVILADTAGLRETEHGIEAEGIRRAQALAARADLKLALFDSTRETADAPTRALLDDRTLTVLTKADKGLRLAQDGYPVSVVTGQGMEAFLEALAQKVQGLLAAGREGPLLTRQRHRAALEEAAIALSRAGQAALPELAAEDMRLALRALGRVTGRVHVEDLLDKIFRDFCIGK